MEALQPGPKKARYEMAYQGQEVTVGAKVGGKTLQAPNSDWRASEELFEQATLALYGPSHSGPINFKAKALDTTVADHTQTTILVWEGNQPKSADSLSDDQKARLFGILCELAKGLRGADVFPSPSPPPSPRASVSPLVSRRECSPSIVNRLERQPPQLQAGNGELARRLEALSQEKDRIEGELDEARADLRRAQAGQRVAEGKLQPLQERIHDLEGQLAQLDELRRELREATEKLSAAERAHDAALAQLQENKRALLAAQGELEPLRQRQVELEGLLRSKDERLQLLTAQLDATSRDLAAVRDEISQLRDRVIGEDKLRRELEAKEKEMARLNGKIAQKRQALTGARLEIDGLRNELSSAQRKLQNKTAENALQAERIRFLEGQVGDLQNAAKRREARILEFSQRLAAQQSNNDDLQREVASLKETAAKVDGLEGQIAADAQRLKEAGEWGRQKQDWEKQIRQLKADNEQLRATPAKTDEHAQKIMALRADNDRLRGDNEALRRRITELEQQSFGPIHVPIDVDKDHNDELEQLRAKSYQATQIFEERVEKLQAQIALLQRQLERAEDEAPISAPVESDKLVQVQINLAEARAEVERLAPALDAALKENARLEKLAKPRTAPQASSQENQQLKEKVAEQQESLEAKRERIKALEGQILQLQAQIAADQDKIEGAQWQAEDAKHLRAHDAELSARDRALLAEDNQRLQEQNQILRRVMQGIVAAHPEAVLTLRDLTEPKRPINGHSSLNGSVT